MESDEDGKVREMGISEAEVRRRWEKMGDAGTRWDQMGSED